MNYAESIFGVLIVFVEFEVGATHCTIFLRLICIMTRRKHLNWFAKRRLNSCYEHATFALFCAHVET